MDITANTEVTAPVVTEQQAVEQAAIERYRESQKTPEELANEVPDGYNPDGTPKEELIAGKFKSQDDLLKAYQELEKKLGTPKEETQPKQEEQTVTNSDGKKVEISKYNQEVATNGSLSDASYKELQDLGFSKKDVDDYIEGQQLIATTFANKLFDIAGGQDNYNTIIQWGAQNLDKSIVDDYNNALAAGDRTKLLQIAEYAVLKYKAVNPAAPKRLEGTGDAYTGTAPFASKVEWQQAASNRLYGKDQKYTAMVDRRYLESRKKGLI